MTRLMTSPSGIAFKIWFLAVIINAILSPFIYVGFIQEFILTVFLVGAFSCIFSFPIFIIIWMLCARLIKKGYSKQDILGALLVTGCVLTVGVYGIFSLMFSIHDTQGIWLCITATFSGSAAILLSYPNIKKACESRDEASLQIEYIGAADY